MSDQQVDRPAEPMIMKMGRLIGQTLQDRGIRQAEFCRRIGVSPRHLNEVVNGQKFAHPTQLEYWAFALGLHFEVTLAPGSVLSSPQHSPTIHATPNAEIVASCTGDGQHFPAQHGPAGGAE